MTRVLSIGYGRQLFDADNTERARMVKYAELFDALHMIVFTPRTHAVSHEPVSPRLSLYGTRTPLRALHVPWAIVLGRRILQTAQGRAGCVITTQDPFEAGCVGWVLSAWYRIPLTVQEHGDVFSTPHWRRESLLNRVRYVVGLFILRRADCVRVVSERSKQGLVALGIPAEKISVLPVRTDVGAFQSATPHADIRATLGHDTTIVLTVGRQVRQKNLPMLLSAFARVHATHPSTHLIVVGRGPLEHALVRQAQTLGIADAVTFMPWSDDVASLMKTADVYALSSNYEGWGRVLIEAMAAGLPVATTDVGCVGEVFMDGRHGTVVPVGDERVFAEALGELVKDASLRQSYAHRGPQDALRAFLPEAEHTKRWGDILMSCGKKAG